MSDTTLPMNASQPPSTPLLQKSATLVQVAAGLVTIVTLFGGWAWTLNDRLTHIETLIAEV